MDDLDLFFGVATGIAGAAYIGGALAAATVLRGRVRNAPSVDIANAVGGKLAQIHGVAVATVEGGVLAAISGAPALVVRTTVEIDRPVNALGRRAPARRVDDVAARDFLVEDAAGHVALVCVERVGVVGHGDRSLHVPSSVDNPDPRIDALLRAHGTSLEQFRAPGVSDRSDFTVREELIASGDEVWVLGEVERLTPSADDGYRASATPEIAVRSAAHGRSAALWRGLYVARRDLVVELARATRFVAPFQRARRDWDWSAFDPFDAQM